jgi:hypothetical protein
MKKRILTFFIILGISFLTFDLALAEDKPIPVPFECGHCDYTYNKNDDCFDVKYTKIEEGSSNAIAIHNSGYNSPLYRYFTTNDSGMAQVDEIRLYCVEKYDSKDNLSNCFKTIEGANDLSTPKFHTQSYYEFTGIYYNSGWYFQYYHLHNFPESICRGFPD